VRPGSSIPLTRGRPRGKEGERGDESRDESDFRPFIRKGGQQETYRRRLEYIVPKRKGKGKKRRRKEPLPAVDKNGRSARGLIKRTRIHQEKRRGPRKDSRSAADYATSDGKETKTVYYIENKMLGRESWGEGGKEKNESVSLTPNTPASRRVTSLREKQKKELLTPCKEGK